MNLQVHFGSFRFWLGRLCGWCCSLRWGLGQSSRLAEGGQWRCGALDVLSLRCLDIRGEIFGLTNWSFREWPGWESQSCGWQWVLTSQREVMWEKQHSGDRKPC